MVEHEICLLTWALGHISHGEWIYIAQEPLNNALIVGNLCEYRRN